MAKKNALTIIALSTLASTATMADFCNKEFLSKTPAVLESGCKIIDAQPLNNGKQCIISTENCTVPVFNTQTNSIDARKDLSVNDKNVFVNDENLKTLYVSVSYPYMYAPKPEQGRLIVSTIKGKDGDFCNEETLKNTPAVLKQGCKLHIFNKEGSQCSVEYTDCTVQPFNPKTNTLDEVKASIIKGSLDIDSRLQDLKVGFKYPRFKVKYGLGIKYN